MRKPKGKLVALLATAMGVVLVAVGAMFWKDVYCHLLLDPRLVGRWKVATREAGEKQPNDFGLHDMHGNARRRRELENLKVGSRRQMGHGG